MKPKKPTRIERGILLAVVWMAKDIDQPNDAVSLAKEFSVHDRDVSDHADFDKEVFAELNEHKGVNFFLG